MKLYIVTAIGVGIDTEVHVFKTREEAYGFTKELYKDFDMDVRYIEEITEDCWRGYSVNADCEIEVEIHEKEI